MKAGRKKGFKHSEETKQKIRKKRIGKRHSEETKIKMSLSSKHHNKGIKLSKKTKKLISRNRKGKCLNEKNFNWKGDKASYSAIHHWVIRKLGKPKKCSICNKTNKLHWANIDHKYLRNLKNWVTLCAKCHKKFDNR